MANTNIMNNWLETGRFKGSMCDQLQQGKIARVSETLEDSAAPPAAQVSRPSRRAGSCLRLLDPETLRAVGGGWRRRGNYGKWKWAARSTSSSLVEQRQVGHFYPAPALLYPLDPDRPLFFKWFVLWSFLLAHFNFQLPLCRLSLICWRGLLDTDRTVAIK